LQSWTAIPSLSASCSRSSPRSAHVLNPAGVTLKIARNTRLVQFTAALDPKILPAAVALAHQ
jgi:hypothetical protein